MMHSAISIEHWLATDGQTDTGLGMLAACIFVSCALRMVIP